MITRDEIRALRDAPVGTVVNTSEGKVRVVKGIVCCMCRWIREHVEEDCPNEIEPCCGPRNRPDRECVVFEPVSEDEERGADAETN